MKFRNAGKDRKHTQSEHHEKRFRGRLSKSSPDEQEMPQAPLWDEALGAQRKLNRIANVGDLIQAEGRKGRPTPRRKESHPVGRQSRTKTSTERVMLAMLHDGTLADAYPYQHGLLVAQRKRTEKGRRKAKAGRRDRVQRGMKARGKR